MKKRLMLSIAAMAGAGMLYQNKRSKANRFDKIARAKIEQGEDLSLDETIDEAGIPDQAEESDPAQLENAKMVSEGSQFGVQYYNELKEKESKVRKRKR